MKKKTFCLAMAAVMAFGLAGCGGAEKNAPGRGENRGAAPGGSSDRRAGPKTEQTGRVCPCRPRKQETAAGKSDSAEAAQG